MIIGFFPWPEHTTDFSSVCDFLCRYPFLFTKDPLPVLFLLFSGFCFWGVNIIGSFFFFFTKLLSASVPPFFCPPTSYLLEPKRNSASPFLEFFPPPFIIGPC